jgi:aminoglycoside phosphotransferase (APT) family kinase protein
MRRRALRADVVSSMVSAALDDFDGLLNWGRLQSWIDAHDVPGLGPVTAVSPLATGTQNNIFRLQRGDAVLILRRPPRHLRANSNRMMLREARVLRALADTPVPHPSVYAVCSDEAVIGANFYLMEPIDGFTPYGALPGPYDAEPRWRTEMGFQIVNAASTLAGIRPDDVDLGDFGNPHGWVERQVTRWRSELDSYRHTSGSARLNLLVVDRVQRWLEQHQPTGYHIGIIHGDLQFTNVMFHRDRPELVALVDWELSTLGDPLLDLGSILASWHESLDPPGHKPDVEPFDGFPARRELVDCYLTKVDRDPAHVVWYFVLACCKLGIILEGTWARAQAGQAATEVGERLHRRAKWLFQKAEQLTLG